MRSFIEESQTEKEKEGPPKGPRDWKADKMLRFAQECLREIEKAEQRATARASTPTQKEGEGKNGRLGRNL